jgi:hypothetical protein
VFSAAQAEKEAGRGVLNRLQAMYMARRKSERVAVAKVKSRQD